MLEAAGLMKEVSVHLVVLSITQPVEESQKLPQLEWWVQLARQPGKLSEPENKHTFCHLCCEKFPCLTSLQLSADDGGVCAGWDVARVD